MASRTVIFCCIFMLLNKEINGEGIFHTDKTDKNLPVINDGTIAPVNPPHPTRAYRTETLLKDAAVVAAIGAVAAAVVGAYAVYNNQKNSDHQNGNDER
uniref:Uncharacterized protein n=1 Tax=Panagrolaimus superbus TaxID=310955 RepID=A0A914YU99_9BILA